MRLETARPQPAQEGLARGEADARGAVAAETGAIVGLSGEVNVIPSTASRAPPTVTAAKLATNFPRDICIVSSRCSFSPRLREWAKADGYLPVNIARKIPEVNHKI